MPKAKRIQSSGSGLGSNIANQLGPAPRKRIASGGTSRGRGRSRTQRDPLAIAAEMVAAKKASDALNKDNDGGLMAGIGDAIGLGKKGLMGALDALDTPRAALLSFGSELGDLVDRDGDHSFDLGTAIKRTRDNYSFGEFLNDEVAQTHDWNPIAKVAAGLAGDILIDPLTWLAPGAKAGELGAMGTSRALFKAGADDLARAGISAEEAASAASRVAKARTASVLSDPERVAAGLVDDAGRVERGVYWNAPGTGRIGRRLHIDQAIDKATGGRYGLSTGDRLRSKQLRIGGGERLSKVNTTLMKPVARAANRLTRSGRWANGADAGFKEMFRSGDPEQGAKGLFGMEATAAGRLQDKRFRDEFGKVTGELLHDARRAGVDMHDLWLVAGGDGPAIARVSKLRNGDQIVERTRALFDDMGIEANARIVDRGGREILNIRDDYTPRFLKPEVREAMGLKGGAMAKRGKRASIEKARKYNAGDELFGTRLVEPAEHPQHWSVERQVDDVLKENGVDDTWFIEDASVAFPLYVRVLSRRVGNEVTAGKLIQSGMGEFAFGFTRAGQTVVDARAKAFSMAEAARRRARIAEGRLGDATEALVAGRSQATRTAKEASQATRDARSAMQDAASALDELGDSPGAMAIREYAEHWTEMADRQASALPRFIASAGDDIDRTTVQIAGLRAEAKILSDEHAALHDRLRSLMDQRQEAWNRASDLWDQANERLQTGRRLHEVDAAIADAQSQIAQVNDLIDDLASATPARPQHLIRQDMDDVSRIQRQLGGRKRAAQAAGDMDELRRVESDLETARLWSGGLRHELKTGKILDDEGLQLLAAGQDDLTQMRLRIRNLRTEAQELGNDNLAMALASLDDRLPAWDASTQSLVSPMGGWEGAWHHGTPIGVDLVHGPVPNPETKLDSLLGLHLTSIHEIAEDFVGRSAQGDLNRGFGGVASFDVAAAPDEVVAYPKGGPDWDWLNNSGPTQTQAEALYTFGTPFGEAKTEILDDALSNAIRTDLLDEDTIVDAIDRAMRADGVFLDADAWDELSIGLQQAMEEVADGGSLREALSRFAETDLDPWWGRVADLPDGSEYMFTHWSRVGNALNLAIEDHMSLEARQAMAEAFKQMPHVQGKKALFYDHGWGAQEMILLDPTVARSAKGPDPLAHTYDDVRNNMRQMITGAAERAQRTAETFDAPVVDATLSFEDAARRAEGNRRNLQMAERELADKRKALSARVRGSLQQEVEYRRRAAEAQATAERVQQEFVEGEMAKVAMLGDAYNARTIDENRIAVHNTRLIASLEASHQSALADLERWERTTTKWDGRFTALQNTHAEMAIDTAIQRGLRMFGASTLLPEDMVEVLTTTTRLQEPGWLRKFLGRYDGVLNLWKGYATTSPGFLNRNLMGGVFNNYLAGVERSSYQRYIQASRGKAKGVWQEGYEAAREAGILTGGQSVGEVAARRGGNVRALDRLNPLKTEFAPIATVRAGSAKSEDFLRGTLFMDVYAKTGGDVDAAIAAVGKYHFDYDDLSAVERSVMRRVVPFYTWTRKNLPLQLEMMARQPAKYNRFTQAKAEIEGLSAEEDTVPGYFGENFAVRLPWTREGGNVYYLPDLPFTSVGETLEPNQVIGNMSPFIKTPVELWAGKQFWQDIPFTDKHLPVSPVMTAIPGLMPALQGLGWATHNANGDWVMKDRHMHAVTNWLPVLGQARRLLPAEAKYQERALTSWMSFFGAGLRTNTTADKAGVNWGKYYDLKEQLAKLEDLGFLERSFQFPEQNEAQRAQAPFSAMANAMEDFQTPESQAENEDLLAFG